MLIINITKPQLFVTSNFRYKSLRPKADVSHIRVEIFKDDISNNLIKSFHHQLNALYKIKQGFKSFDSANNLISMFVFFFNFVRLPSSLDGLTPAQVAGMNLTKNLIKNIFS